MYLEDSDISLILSLVRYCVWAMGSELIDRTGTRIASQGTVMSVNPKEAFDATFCGM